MSERVVDLRKVKTWMTDLEGDTFSPDGLEYLENFSIDPHPILKWGLDKFGGHVWISGVTVRFYWPEGFDFERFRLLAGLVPHRYY